MWCLNINSEFSASVGNLLVNPVIPRIQRLDVRTAEWSVQFAWLDLQTPLDRCWKRTLCCVVRACCWPGDGRWSMYDNVVVTALLFRTTGGVRDHYNNSDDFYSCDDRCWHYACYASMCTYFAVVYVCIATCVCARLCDVTPRAITPGVRFSQHDVTVRVTWIHGNTTVI